MRLWAEKEMRNLKRLQTAGIRCPEAFEVRENVLVMAFLGNEDCWFVQKTTQLVDHLVSSQAVASTKGCRYSG